MISVELTGASLVSWRELQLPDEVQNREDLFVIDATMEGKYIFNNFPRVGNFLKQFLAYRDKFKKIEKKSAKFECQSTWLQISTHSYHPEGRKSHSIYVHTSCQHPRYMWMFADWIDVKLLLSWIWLIDSFVTEWRKNKRRREKNWRKINKLKDYDVNFLHTSLSMNLIWKLNCFCEIYNKNFF